VTGRANFEYAVPLRSMAGEPGVLPLLHFEMSGCTAMDSTFMGVLSMLGLRAIREGKQMELVNASDFLQKLLRDLGIARLFSFVQADPPALSWQELGGAAAPKLVTAETVSEAHETLVEADAANGAKFKAVIDYAKADVERLKKESGGR